MRLDFVGGFVIPMVILLVEDEPLLAEMVERSLRQAGHDVRLACDGPAAVREALGGPQDLIILDVNLPGHDGFEVLAKIRGLVTARVLMLTARSEVGDRVAGLRAGADDYLTKPFAMEELLARVEALGRRGQGEAAQRVLSTGDLTMDVEHRRVTRAGARVDLSPREFDVLRVLMSDPERTFSRDEICERIWERQHEYDTRTVEIFIMRLRRKLDAPGKPSRILTVRHAGYKIHTTS